MSAFIRPRARNCALSVPHRSPSWASGQGPRASAWHVLVNQAAHPVVGEARRGLVRLLVRLQQPAAVVAELAVCPAWLVDCSQVAIVRHGQSCPLPIGRHDGRGKTAVRVALDRGHQPGRVGDGGQHAGSVVAKLVSDGSGQRILRRQVLSGTVEAVHLLAILACQLNRNGLRHAGHRRLRYTSTSVDGRDARCT
jgi:hypothetical protein